MVGDDAVWAGLEALGELRLIALVVVFAVLVYWTLERVWGEDEDPTLRFSLFSETGTLSFLSSGLGAVMLVAGLGIALLYPDLVAEASGAGPIVAVLVGLVAVHWWWEKEERE